MKSEVRSMMFSVAVAFSLLASRFAEEQTAEEDATMAAQYTKQAVALRANANKHAKLASIHRSGLAGSGKTSHESIVPHFETIDSNLNTLAIETEALAVTHGMAAEKPASK